MCYKIIMPNKFCKAEEYKITNIQTNNLHTNKLSKKEMNKIIPLNIELKRMNP